MRIRRAVLFVGGGALIGALVGVSVGFVLGRFLPGYYRSIFVRGDDPQFDPVAIGVGLGLTQGLIGGACIGLLLVAILAWHDVRKDRTGAIPQVIRDKPRRAARGCLLSVGVLALLAGAAYFYFRTPHFSGSTPVSIDIRIQSPDVPAVESNVVVQATITDRRIASSLFALLRSARFGMGHKCSDVGSFTIRYTNGKTDTLGLLPGHNPTRYEFRCGAWLYRLPRDRFYRVLRDAGVDTTKMPENEH